VAHHVHWTAQLGAWVLISAGWYQLKVDLHQTYRRPGEQAFDSRPGQAIAEMYRSQLRERPREGSKWGWIYALVLVALFALGYGLSFLLARTLHIALWARGISFSYLLTRMLRVALWARWIRLFIWR
jgi:hypothetical protein